LAAPITSEAPAPVARQYNEQTLASPAANPGLALLQPTRLNATTEEQTSPVGPSLSYPHSIVETRRAIPVEAPTTLPTVELSYPASVPEPLAPAEPIDLQYPTSTAGTERVVK